MLALSSWKSPKSGGAQGSPPSGLVAGSARKAGSRPRRYHRATHSYGALLCNTWTTETLCRKVDRRQDISSFLNQRDQLGTTDALAHVLYRSAKGIVPLQTFPTAFSDSCTSYAACY
jgi:hypothetical protein